MIRYVIEKNEMPPWPPDQSYNKMAHERVLSEQEKSTILTWIFQGMTKGDSSIAPATPIYNSSQVIVNPDLSLQIPQFTVPSISEDLYQCFVLNTGLSTQKFISGIEIIPGNSHIVHHVQVFYDTTGICEALDVADPGLGYSLAGGVGTPAAVLMGTWVPGSSPIFVPAGMGKRLPANARIVMQIHYPEFASLESDSTSLHLLFTSNNVRNINDAPILSHSHNMTNGPLFIPANTVKTFYEQFTSPIQATVLGIGPHGHLLCKSMKAFAVTLAGDTIPLIDIPEWDFHWQGMYQFPKPVRIPFGTKLIGIATYDNTSNNPNNPNNPPEDVSLGEATTDEMMLFFFSYLQYQAGDENIIIDTASHPMHYLNCVSLDKSVALNETKLPDKIKMFPNPVSDILYFESNIEYKAELFSLEGQLLLSVMNPQKIELGSFENGIYFIAFHSDRGIRIEKIIIHQ